MSGKDSFTIAGHFEDKAPIVRKTYDQLVKVLKGFGRIVEEPKKTSTPISTE